MTFAAVFLSQGHFRASPFLVGSTATVADVVVFGDVGQMHFLGLLDFSPYPHVLLAHVPASSHFIFFISLSIYQLFPFFVLACHVCSRRFHAVGGAILVQVLAWMTRMTTLPGYEESHSMFPMLKKAIQKAKIKAAATTPSKL
jgi:hypothetical protein